MITLAIVLGVLMAGGLIWFVLAMCRAGAEADEEAERTFRRMKHGR